MTTSARPGFWRTLRVAPRVYRGYRETESRSRALRWAWLNVWWALCDRLPRF